MGPGFLRKWIGAGALALMMVAGARASAADAGGLYDRVKTQSPTTGAEREILVIESATEDLAAVAFSYLGPALPGEDSIVLLLDAPEATEIFAARLVPYDRHWSVPKWPKTFEKLPELTQYALWREPSGRWGAMICMTGGGMITYLSGAPGAIKISAHSYDSNFEPQRVPMFAIGHGDDPYELTQKLYAFGLKIMREVDPGGVIGRVRSEKAYPKIFEYAGWCSWNAYYREVTAEDILSSGRWIKDSGFPIRWMIIDDGWQVIEENKDYKVGGRYQSITQFEAHPEKFPDGLAAVVNALKNDYGITWVGVWHTLLGYWCGIDLDGEIAAAHADDLLPVNPAYALPDPRSDAGQRFWRAYHGFMADAGVDFVKTDDQSTMDGFVKDLLPISHAYANTQRNFQASADQRFGGNVINCMSMGVDAIYQWKTTNVARVSRDFYPGLPHNPRAHTVDCVMNSIWFGNLAWPDYDMWQTHGQHPEYHAVARAISGGPVYVTDTVGKERFKHLWPLVLADGKVIRANAPGQPARRSLFVNPYVAWKPLVAFARCGVGGAIGVWNVDRFERPMKSAVSPSDVEGLEGEQFAVYEFYSGELQKVGRHDEVKTWLQGWDARLYSVVPVVDGFAPIGLASKYLAPGTVVSVTRGEDQVTVRLAESGPFVAYCERRPRSVKVDGVDRADMIEYAEGKLRLKLTEATSASKEVEVEVSW